MSRHPGGDCSARTWGHDPHHCALAAVHSEAHTCIDCGATFAAQSEPAMVVVVTGGRWYKHRERLFEVLDAFHAATPIVRLAHGAATGADAFADDWARLRGVPVVAYPVLDADWMALGKRAGNERNARMIESERPDIVIAFPGGKGTADAVRTAERRHIDVMAVDAVQPALFGDAR